MLTKNVVSKMIEKECKEETLFCFIINTSEAWISKNDLEKGHLVCIKHRW